MAGAAEAKEPWEGKEDKKPPVAPSVDPFLLPGEKRVNIVIDEQEGHEGTTDVKLSCNGVVCVIQRGKVVAVAERYVGILRDAVYEIITKDDEGNDQMRRVPRFAWRIVPD